MTYSKMHSFSQAEFDRDPPKFPHPIIINVNARNLTFVSIAVKNGKLQTEVEPRQVWYCKFDNRWKYEEPKWRKNMASYFNFRKKPNWKDKARAPAKKKEKMTDEKRKQL